MLGRWCAARVFLWGGISLALLPWSPSLRSRWVGGHRVLYAAPTAAAHVAVCSSWANYSSTRRSWSCALCVFGGRHSDSHHVPLYSKAPPRVAARPPVSAGASRASPFHLA